ncbi:MAG TPA: nodulation protein NfeD [Candidatus Acidoferrum sp.]|jgi:membrane-bound serine protease (ClpP class)|nr:nodulation protein NfeD [Candidatus Acidoferrum sp.]
MRKRFALTFGIVLFGLVLLSPVHAAAAAPHVERADLVGDINTIMAAYMENAVSRAEADHADALLVVINTPGGISTSMDDIVTSLLNSTVPVIAYVYPSGARAASAGLFVAQAADVLAMAPGTNIGSAHPIDASGANLTGDLGTKVLNDAVTRVRSLASMHGRNADWAEQAVRNSVNINAEDAVRLHVADLEVADPNALLQAIDGRTVSRPSGTFVLHTAGASIDDMPMPFWQVLLNALIDPTVAALLIIVAGFGIITELLSPGGILPGVVGGLAGILAIVSLANLPVNIAAALLMLLALLLFIADLKASTHGILSVGGVFALVLGMAFLINTGPIGLGVNPLVALGTGVVTLTFFLIFIRKIWQARRPPPFVGVEAMVGAVGEAREELAPEGLVFVSGALWKAVATPEPIHAGAPVRVIGRNGLQLNVVRGENGADVATKEKS